MLSITYSKWRRFAKNQRSFVRSVQQFDVYVYVHARTYMCTCGCIHTRKYPRHTHTHAHSHANTYTNYIGTIIFTLYIIQCSDMFIVLQYENIPRLPVPACPRAFRYKTIGRSQDGSNASCPRWFTIVAASNICFHGGDNRHDSGSTICPALLTLRCVSKTLMP